MATRTKKEELEEVTNVEDAREDLAEKAVTTQNLSYVSGYPWVGDPHRELISLPNKSNKVHVAFARAQAKMEHVKKSSDNPFFKSKYADLATVVEEVRRVFSEEGLYYIQLIEDNNVVTIVGHEDGSTLPRSSCPIISKDFNDPQKYGSAITYARRYALMAYVGLAPEDDDGNAAASARVPSKKPTSDIDSRLLNALTTAGYTTKEQRGSALKDRWKGATLTEDQKNLWIKELESVNDTPTF